MRPKCKYEFTDYMIFPFWLLVTFIYVCLFSERLTVLLDSVLSLLRLCKLEVRPSKWIKGRPVEQEMLPLTPGCLLSDYLLTRSEVLSQATVSACVNSLDRRG